MDNMKNEAFFEGTGKPRARGMPNRGLRGESSEAEQTNENVFGPETAVFENTAYNYDGTSGPLPMFGEDILLAFLTANAANAAAHAASAASIAAHTATAAAAAAAYAADIVHSAATVAKHAAASASTAAEAASIAASRAAAAEMPQPTNRRPRRMTKRGASSSRSAAPSGG